MNCSNTGHLKDSGSQLIHCCIVTARTSWSPATCMRVSGPTRSSITIWTPVEPTSTWATEGTTRDHMCPGGPRSTTGRLSERRPSGLPGWSSKASRGLTSHGIDTPVRAARGPTTIWTSVTPVWPTGTIACRRCWRVTPSSLSGHRRLSVPTSTYRQRSPRKVCVDAK